MKFFSAYTVFSLDWQWWRLGYVMINDKLYRTLLWKCCLNWLEVVQEIKWATWGWVVAACQIGIYSQKARWVLLTYWHGWLNSSWSRDGNWDTPLSASSKARNYESINCIYSYFFKGILRNKMVCIGYLNLHSVPVFNCLNCLSFLLLCSMRLRSVSHCWKKLVPS